MSLDPFGQKRGAQPVPDPNVAGYRALLPTAPHGCILALPRIPTTARARFSPSLSSVELTPSLTEAGKHMLQETSPLPPC